MIKVMNFKGLHDRDSAAFNVFQEDSASLEFGGEVSRTCYIRGDDPMLMEWK